MDYEDHNPAINLTRFCKKNGIVDTPICNVSVVRYLRHPEDL